MNAVTSSPRNTQGSQRDRELGARGGAGGRGGRPGGSGGRQRSLLSGLIRLQADGSSFMLRPGAAASRPETQPQLRTVDSSLACSDGVAAPAPAASSAPTPATA